MAVFSSFATTIYENQTRFRNQGKFCASMLFACGSSFFTNPMNNDSEINYAKKLLNGSKELTDNIREMREGFNFNKARDFFDGLFDEKDDSVFNDIFEAFLGEEPTKSKELLIIALTNTLEEYMIHDLGYAYSSVKDHYLALMANDELLPNIASPDDFDLIIESNYRCPVTRRKLIKDEKKQYVIVRIFPSGLDERTESLFKSVSRKPRNLDSKENLIALSTSVAYGYIKDHPLEMFMKLVDIKKKNKAGVELEERLDDIDIEQNITNLLDSLSNITDHGALEPLSMEALRISDKIPETMVGTYSTIETLALKFYNFIDAHLALLEKELVEDEHTIDGKSTKLGMSIKALSKEYSEAGTPIPDHIDRLAHKLIEKTGYPESMIDIAKIVVAYFVQHCEVLSNENA
jgi:hypothetical protein